MNIKEKLFEEFNKRLSINSFGDENLIIDKKHKRIVNAANKIISKDKKKFLKHFKNWEMQTDMDSPPQISLDHLKILGLKKFIIICIKKLLFFKNISKKNEFFDDLKIIEMSNALDLLKKNPVHLTPGCDNFYKFEKNYSTNTRWNRYAYIAGKIINQNLLLDNNVHLDIGSYYGGLQSFLKKKYPNANYVMVDFPHQLLRSYIFLNILYPKSEHIINEELKSKNLPDLKGSFIYIPTTNFNLLEKINFDLVTNFYSFGEMKREEFLNYFNSKSITNSKIIYMVNRVMSAPFFEKTFDSDLNIFDYMNLNSHNLKYFDIFPMGHYSAPQRLLFDSFRARPISSPYFECILKKI